MSNPLVIQVGLSRSASFRTEAEGARKDMERLDAAVNQTAAALTSMQRQARLPGGMTDAMQAGIKATRTQLQGLQAELRTARTEYQALSTAGGAGGGHGGGGNKAQMAHSGRAVLEMLMAGQSPIQALQIEAPRIVQAQGGGLGAMLGVGAGIAVVNKVVESIGEGIAKAKEMGAALREAVRPGPTQGASSIEAMTKRIEELDTVIEESKPKIGFLERTWQRSTNLLGARKDEFSRIVSGQSNPFTRMVWEPEKGSTQGEKNEAMRNQALEERKKLYGEINAQMSKENDLRERAFAQGKASVEIDELRLKKAHALAEAEDKKGIAQMQAKIAEIEANPTEKADVKAKRIAQIREELEIKQHAFEETAHQLEREYELREKIVNLAHQLQKIEADGRRADASDRSEGVDNAVTKTQHALDVAIAKRNALPEGSKEREEANTEVLNRGADHEEAVRARERHLAGNDSARYLAGLRGPEYEKRRKELEERQQILDDQLDPTSKTYERNADTRDDRQTELEQNHAEQHQMKRLDKQREFRRREQQIAIETGNGPGQRVAAIDKALTLNADQQADNDANEKNEDIAKSLLEKAHALGQEKARILQTEKDSLATLKEQTTTVQQQGYELNGRQKAEKIRKHFDTQIERAKFEGQNPAVIAEMERQRDATVLNAQVDEEMMTPGQRRRRTDANRRREAAEARVRQRNGTGSTRAKEAAGNGHSMTFDELLHQNHPGLPVVLPAQRPNAHDATPKPAPVHDMKTAMANTEGYLSKIWGKMDTFLS